jgi:uncharacterized membrane protein YheB (UPF0754 family)
VAKEIKGKVDKEDKEIKVDKVIKWMVNKTIKDKMEVKVDQVGKGEINKNN